MDTLERFDETSLPDKESFYSSLNMENIDNIDYRHGNNVFKKFELKNLGEYHDLYVSFYSSLNMENIDDIDCRHGNNVFKKFKLKNLGEYHDLYV